MMFFTCEIHNEKFATFEALKKHDQEVHSAEKISKSGGRSKRKIEKDEAVSLLQAAKRKDHDAGVPDKRRRTSATASSRTVEYAEIGYNQTSAVRNQQQYRCHICAEIVLNSDGLTKHLEGHANDPSTIKMVQNVPYSQQVKTEVTETEGGNNVSAIEDVIVEDEDDVEIVGIVSKIKKFLMPCKFCSKRFKNSELLSEHINSEHHQNENVGNQAVRRERTHRERVGKGYKYASNVTYTGKYNRRPEKQLFHNIPDKPSYNPLLPMGKISCYFCGYRPNIQNASMFERHVWRHTLERPFRCRICSRIFRNQIAVDVHENTHKESEGRKYRCKQCSSSFRDRSTLVKHQATHSTACPFKCQDCGNAYKRNGQLRRHIISSHLPSDPFSCKICSKGFGRRDLFNSHLQSVHKDLSKEDITNLIKTAIDSLPSFLKPQVPTSSVKVNSYPCKCGRKFGTKEEYRDHLVLAHRESRVNYCIICNKDYSQLSGLKYHIVKNHQ